MAKTIQIIRQYDYGLMICINCTFTRSYRSIKTTTNKLCNITPGTLKRFAIEDGWTENKRHQWICPSCSKKEYE